MDLSTNYMGLYLKNPIIVSSSKLTGEIESLVKCQEAGAGAVVLKSVFEEQIRAEAESTVKHADSMYYWFPEAKDQVLGLSIDTKLDRYLKLIKQAKEQLYIPVIASINCKSPDDWPKFSRVVQEYGADALELNIAIFPFESSVTSGEIEDKYIDILKEVKKNITIPVAVKLSPYFTNIFNLVKRLADNGADSVVIFNRFYRPDIDINTLKNISDINFSTPEEMTISMRWIALLFGSNYGCQLAASSGIHDHVGVIKQLLSGADVVQICSTLYLNGLERIKQIIDGLESWMNEKGYKSIGDFRGAGVSSKELLALYERIQFMKRDMS